MTRLREVVVIIVTELGVEGITARTVQSSLSVQMVGIHPSVYAAEEISSVFNGMYLLHLKSN